MADVVSQEVDIELREKLSDGTYKLKYPKTRIEQVAGIASKVEAEGGSNNVKFMTPLRVKEAIGVSSAMRLLQTINVSVATNTINFTIPAGITELRILGSKIKSTNASNDRSLSLTFDNDVTTSYNYSRWYVVGSTLSAYNTDSTNMPIGDNILVRSTFVNPVTMIMNVSGFGVGTNARVDFIIQGDAAGRLQYGGGLHKKVVSVSTFQLKTNADSIAIGAIFEIWGR